MPAECRKLGFTGVIVAGLLLITGCMEQPMGPAPVTTPIDGAVHKSAALSTDSTVVGVSISRTGTSTVNATFNSSNH